MHLKLQVRTRKISVIHVRSIVYRVIIDFVIVPAQTEIVMKYIFQKSLLRTPDHRIEHTQVTPFASNRISKSCTCINSQNLLSRQSESGPSHILSSISQRIFWSMVVQALFVALVLAGTKLQVLQ